MDLFFEPKTLQIPSIDGLKYLPDFITANEESDLIAQIDASPWRKDLKRRVQHYGYYYDYKSRAVDKNDYLGKLPDWLSCISLRLYKQGYFEHKPDQIIINEYEPGQGISAHIDCEPCFGDTIASLSLLSGTLMEFKNNESGESESIYLENRSLIILSDAARYHWTHAIPARKSDIIDDIKIIRQPRISLTFRTVKF